mmetsp:Transcript_39525/g.47516  ORF Transcript_39525/g.47516 Transcript_39525/m.47516 type:complete len:82 (-) Transcript_39525:362-607(-)
MKTLDCFSWCSENLKHVRNILIIYIVYPSKGLQLISQMFVRRCSQYPGRTYISNKRTHFEDSLEVLVEALLTEDIYKEQLN